MEHTKNYMDALWVAENPEKYDNRDVVRANSFIEAYNEGYNKALRLSDVDYQLPHHFNAPDENKRSLFCRCGKYLTDDIHLQQL